MHKGKVHVSKVAAFNGFYAKICFQRGKLTLGSVHLTISIDIHVYFRQNIGGKAVADTASGSASNTRSKPLETKKSSSGKPLQKVAPVYVKKVVAEIVTSVDQIEEPGRIKVFCWLKPLHTSKNETKFSFMKNTLFYP